MKTSIQLKNIQTKMIQLKIKGLSPLICHAWSEKAKRMIREKHAGSKAKNREVRDPVKEFLDAQYRDSKDRHSIPCIAIKNAMIGAAHKDIGIEKTLVRKAVFIKCDDPSNNIPIEFKGDEDGAPFMREDVVKVGMAQTDMRYRPEYRDWSVIVDMEYDSELLSEEVIVNLLNRAGFGVGLHEFRPEKGGDFGRFEVDKTFGIKGG